MGENLRIDELRRRVLADPASIAFAALAEEYRRVGNFAEAIETCLAGLKRHPSYLSAHVTLGRALIEVGRFDEAEQELQLVLKAAPENLAAIRGLAEIHHRRDHGYDEAHEMAKHAADAAAAEAAGAAAETTPFTEAPGAYEPPSYETPSYEPAAYAPPAFASAVAPPPIDAPPIDPPQYEPPPYDPPGTFEMPQFSAAVQAQPSPFSYGAPVAVSDHDRELEALERFLAAVTAARETARTR